MFDSFASSANSLQSSVPATPPQPVDNMSAPNPSSLPTRSSMSPPSSSPSAQPDSSQDLLESSAQMASFDPATLSSIPCSSSKPNVNYITLSADTTVSRPSPVENLKNLTIKSKQAGRKGTKKKALMYPGPTSDHQEVSKKRVASSGHPVPTPPLASLEEEEE